MNFFPVICQKYIDFFMKDCAASGWDEVNLCSSWWCAVLCICGKTRVGHIPVLGLLLISGCTPFRLPHQTPGSLKTCGLRVGNRLREDIPGTADPNGQKTYSMPYDMFSNKSSWKGAGWRENVNYLVSWCLLLLLFGLFLCRFFFLFLKTFSFCFLTFNRQNLMS